MRFADYGKRVVFAAFDGGEIMASAGVLLLREQDAPAGLHVSPPLLDPSQPLVTDMLIW